MKGHRQLGDEERREGGGGNGGKMSRGKKHTAQKRGKKEIKLDLSPTSRGTSRQQTHSRNSGG